MIKRIKKQERETMTREEFIDFTERPYHISGRRHRLQSGEGRNAFRRLPGAVDPGASGGHAAATEGIRAGGNQYPVRTYLYSQSRQTGRISLREKYDFHDP